MEILNIKVPEGTKEKLRALSPNVSELVREKIEELLNRRGGSALDKAGALVGSIDSGRPDLATTKDHLKHYGKKSHR